MQLIGLKTKVLGQKIDFYKEIDSTQDEIWRLCERKIASGTLVIADKQTKGKGTHGRKWYTEDKKSIAFSFYIKTDCEISNVEGITIKIAETIIEIMKEKYNIRLDIKKPNDIIFNGKKIAGILTESKIIKEKVVCLVIGIGINTLQESFREEIDKKATSIKKEFGVEVNREEFIIEFCNRFEKYLIEKEIIFSE